MELVFTGKLLLNLNTDSSTPSYSLAPVRYVLESPRCQLSNGVSHILLASVPTELQAISRRPAIRSHPSDMFRNPIDAGFPTAAPTASWCQSPPSYRLLWNWSLLTCSGIPLMPAF
ncbi:hypothetical protein L873DRAFT_782631 [Choiromyces venosus 120613-1]|uniref:Uncharacterized protein n=1 Tax=Choiromyces venosus 120613-1 TaxID=1336337 RepID=A0A3N4IU47_9PEZI|nr:hypothetical protein L873DRAFT_782631 [Choiromyces venosus 120613-1]